MSEKVDALRRQLNTPWDDLTQEERDGWNAIEAAGIGASPTPPTTEGRGTIPFDKTDLAQLQQVREELRNRWRASAWQLLCRTIDDLESRALLSSPRVEDVRREALEEAAKVAEEMAANRERVSAAAAYASWSIAKRIRSLSLPDGEGDKQATRGDDAATAPTDH